MRTANTTDTLNAYVEGLEARAHVNVNGNGNGNGNGDGWGWVDEYSCIY